MSKIESLYFPMFFDLSDKKIVVIGAGTIAARRVRTMIDFVKHITVVAPNIGSEMAELSGRSEIEIIQKPYEAKDINHADIVIAATDDRALNEEIADACSRRNLLVNVASNQTRCDFHFPGIVRRGAFVAGFHAGGIDHKRVKNVRKIVEKALDETEKNKSNEG